MKFPEGFRHEGGVFYPKERGNVIAYTDGSSVENYLEKVLGSATDLSSTSVELRDAIRDWPSRYHLSAERSNLLRCLEIDPAARVLEIGAGCGAITRYLAEHVSEVCAVEGSSIRARLCRMRCRELDRARIIAGDVLKLELDETFDIVTLIGVLEYAGVYCREVADPFRHMLTVAASFLRPGGQLLIAIENKLGIKYFSGCGEDHGVPLFSGLEGYPEETGVQTFGRHELEAMLRASGLAPTALILPFPDYKIPNSFVNAAHASADEAVRFDLIDWCRKPYQDYMQKRAYLFDDHLVLGELAKNGMLADHANSFLMIATKGEPAGRAPIGPLAWIATRYNVARHPRYRTTTKLLSADGQPTIVKTPMGESPASAAPPNGIEHVLAKERFVENAESMAMVMLRAFRKKEGAERAVTALLREWLDVLSRLDGSGGDGTNVKGELIDCIPDNLLRSGASPWEYIDREWRWSAPVSVDWIVYRGLVSFWNHHALAVGGLESFKASACDAFVARCFELLGPFDADAFEQLRKQEQVLQTMVLGGPAAPSGAGTKAQARPRGHGFVISGRTLVNPPAPSAASTSQPADTFAQLYIDDGSGFSEEHSIQISLGAPEEELEFDVSSYPNIRGLRLDPINCPAVIELRQFRLVTRGDVCLDLSPSVHYQPNGTLLSGGKIHFRDGDPQITILRSIPPDLKLLRACVRYLATGPDVRSL